ncbi:MAG: nitronate monooxygenase [Candidatus Dormibacteria bacterium]
MAPGRFQANELAEPIVLAPMAGGPSTPALAAAVSGAGGLGFLGGGYMTPSALATDVARTRELTHAPFGVNLFVPGLPAKNRTDLDAYAARLEGEYGSAGLPLPSARWDDDGWAQKLASLLDDPVAVVSFTFGCPSGEVIRTLKDAGSAVWVTVTDVDEAAIAVRAGADALVAQGIEAGGHRASFTDREVGGDLGLLALLRLLANASGAPLVAAGGIADGPGIAAVLAAGAVAAQIGTGFLRCPESGRSAVHEEALQQDRATTLTRAFTGRRARGLLNRFIVEHEKDAISAYPEVHYLTAPLRAAAREAKNPELVNLWAGQAYPLARAVPAADLVHELGASCRRTLVEVAVTFTSPHDTQP